MATNILDLLKQDSEARIAIIAGAFHIKDGIAIGVLKENKINFQAIISPISAKLLTKDNLEELVKKHFPQKSELINEIRKRAKNIFIEAVNKSIQIPLDKSQGFDTLQLKQASQYMDKLDWLLSQKPIK
jgi:CRISPR/Cas system endoribonuclease Cas6 (RAMP superfamily)